MTNICDTFSHFSLPTIFTFFYVYPHLSRKSDIMVKVIVNYLRQITNDHANDVTTINWPNAISCFVPSSVPLACLVNGQTCEFCLIHPLDSLDNLFGRYACQLCLRYEKQVDLIQVCDLKRRPFLGHMRMWAQTFSHISTTF